mmetsp:Transcript_10138/g.38468  ORF Transcript_10138/g.38468 Transcript_10138/m.38468 type:complete len:520 (-) Transcript_10138:487-2046(-)
MDAALAGVSETLKHRVMILHAVQSNIARRPVGRENRHTRELPVEQRRVQTAHDLGLPRRRDLQLQQRSEVEIREHGMLLDFVRIARPGSQPLVRVAREEALQEVLRPAAEVPGELQLRSPDLLEQLLSVPAVEGREPSQHLVEQRPEAPPIHRSAMSLSVQDLGREILGGSTKGSGPPDIRVDPLLAQAEVRQLYMPHGVEKNVLGLQISVDNVETVDVLQRTGNLRCVELRPGLLEPSELSEVEEQLAPRAVVQHEEELVSRLEGHVQTDDEGVPDVPQDAALRLRVLHLIPPDDVCFPEHLHGIDLLSLLFTNKEDLAEASLPDHLEQLEGIQPDCPAPLGWSLRHPQSHRVQDAPSFPRLVRTTTGRSTKGLPVRRPQDGRSRVGRAVHRGVRKSAGKRARGGGRPRDRHRVYSKADPGVGTQAEARDAVIHADPSIAVKRHRAHVARHEGTSAVAQEKAAHVLNFFGFEIKLVLDVIVDPPRRGRRRIVLMFVVGSAVLSLVKVPIKQLVHFHFI